MTNHDLDLTQSHFVKQRGDLTLYGSWFGENLHPCLVVVPTQRSNPIPLVVELNVAWRWNPDDPDVDPRFTAPLVMQFLSLNGMEFTNVFTHMKVVSLIHDHLEDLIRMPAKPTTNVVVADVFRTDNETGKTVHQEIIKRV